MRYLVVLCAALALGGCAKIHDTGMRLVATPVPVQAVINADTLSGTALLHVDRTGTLNLTSASRSDLTCMGRLRYTATTRGVILLQCSDGNKATLDFNAIQESAGHASGHGSAGPVHLTFGLEAEMAGAYLGPGYDKRASAANPADATTSAGTR